MSDLTPYLCVANSRAAIDWYGEVLQATVKGKPYVMEDWENWSRRVDHR
jgi:PhnB protein